MFSADKTEEKSNKDRRLSKRQHQDNWSGTVFSHKKHSWSECEVFNKIVSFFSSYIFLWLALVSVYMFPVELLPNFKDSSTLFIYQGNCLVHPWPWACMWWWWPTEGSRVPSKSLSCTAVIKTATTWNLLWFCQSVYQCIKILIGIYCILSSIITESPRPHIRCFFFLYIFFFESLLICWYSFRDFSWNPSAHI